MYWVCECMGGAAYVLFCGWRAESISYELEAS